MNSHTSPPEQDTTLSDEGSFLAGFIVTMTVTAIYWAFCLGTGYAILSSGGDMAILGAVLDVVGLLATGFVQVMWVAPLLTSERSQRQSRRRKGILAGAGLVGLASVLALIALFYFGVGDVTWP